LRRVRARRARLARSHSPRRSVRMKAREAGVDLKFVHGSGPRDASRTRIFDAHIARRRRRQTRRAGRPMKPSRRSRLSACAGRIAENMAKSARRIAHFLYVEEVDVTALEELRAALNARASEERPKLTCCPFSSSGSSRRPQNFRRSTLITTTRTKSSRASAQSTWAWRRKRRAGLMVPVVRHAETLSLHECAREMRRVSEARAPGRSRRATSSLVRRSR